MSQRVKIYLTLPESPKGFFLITNNYIMDDGVMSIVTMTSLYFGHFLIFKAEGKFYAKEVSLLVFSA